MAAIALGIVACSTAEKQYKVTAELPSTDFDGQMVYIKDLFNNQKLDSALVYRSSVVFTAPIENEAYCYLQIGDKYVMDFILERADITLNFAERTIFGGALNKKKTDFLALQAEAGAKAQMRYLEVQKAMEENPDPSKLEDLLVDVFVNEVKPSEIILHQEFIKNNTENILCIQAISNLSTLVDAKEILNYTQMLNPEFQKHPVVEDITFKAESSLKSAIGEMFTDFSAEQPDGSDRSFSHYVGKGKYVLVDFWASWCAPCRAEMSNLKNIYAQFQGDQFDILGVAVWDKPDDSIRALEELALPWSQILNAQKTPTELYGIQGIPQIILFDPDGKIIARDLHGELIVEKLNEILSL